MGRVLTATADVRRLVAQVEVEARARAAAILADAGAEGARVRAAAREEAAAVRDEARRAGLEDGRARAAAALAEVALARQARLDGLEGQIAAAALEVARAVLGAELSAHPARVLELARRALRPVRTHEEVLVRVNPEDAPLLRAGAPALGAALARAPGLSLREDPCVPRGGVVVETEAGRVDARAEAQLELVERALAEALG